MAYCRWFDSDLYCFGSIVSDEIPEGEPHYRSNGSRIVFRTLMGLGNEDGYADNTQQAFYDRLAMLRKAGSEIPDRAFKQIIKEADDDVAEFEHFQKHPEYQYCLSTCKFMKFEQFHDIESGDISDAYTCKLSQETLTKDEDPTETEGVTKYLYLKRCQKCLDNPPAMDRPERIITPKTVEIDHAAYEEFEKACQAAGVAPEEAITMLIKAAVHCKGLDFPKGI
ncbi:MAG: hypothetical protein FWG12_07845 [Holophagaceae bacterium]|nr:hypothetical protein [Holophagaceae bacterium]